MKKSRIAGSCRNWPSCRAASAWCPFSIIRWTSCSLRRISLFSDKTTGRAPSWSSLSSTSSGLAAGSCGDGGGGIMRMRLTNRRNHCASADPERRATTASAAIAHDIPCRPDRFIVCRLLRVDADFDVVPAGEVVILRRELRVHGDTEIQQSGFAHRHGALRAHLEDLAGSPDAADERASRDLLRKIPLELFAAVRRRERIVPPGGHRQFAVSGNLQLVAAADPQAGGRHSELYEV